MNKHDLIREIVYDDERISGAIKEVPQTYNTILQSLREDGTLRVILHRRMARLLKNGEVWKMKVPGTRYGLALFCAPERDYKIMVMQHFTGVRIFYMFDYVRKEKSIALQNYWELKGPNWSKWEFSDEPFLVPLYSIRDEGFRIWE